MDQIPLINTDSSPSDELFITLKAINKEIFTLIDRKPRKAEDQVKLIKLRAMQDKYMQAVILLNDHKL